MTNKRDYQWSSYAYNAMGKPNNLLTNHILYNALGNDNELRQYAYRELFNNQLDKDEVHSIRESLNQELVLGRDDFKEKIEQMTKRQVRPAQWGDLKFLKCKVSI